MNTSTEHILQCNQSEPLADASGRIVDLMNENVLDWSDANQMPSLGSVRVKIVAPPLLISPSQREITEIKVLIADIYHTCDSIGCNEKYI